MKSRLPQGVRDNLRFLVAEVGSQVLTLQRYFKTGSVSLARNILERSGYVYNLRTRIHDTCLHYATSSKGKTYDPQVLRAMESIASDLERIAELGRDTLHHLDYLKQQRCIKHQALAPLLGKVEKGVQLVLRSVESGDTDLALKLGKIEQRLDAAYRKLHRHYLAKLKRKRHTDDLIASLFAAHCVEQMGDALLHISESIITANLGLPVDTDRYHSLQASMAELEDGGQGNLVVESIAETRSGSGISGIGSPDDAGEGYVAVFKDGTKRKLKEELEGVERWHKTYPGLVPKILSYRKHGKNASLLIEHLPGQTLEHILLNESQALLDDAVDQLTHTLKSVWRATRQKRPVGANYMGQLAKRLDAVYTVHPEFRQGGTSICGLPLESFDELLHAARAYEENLAAPYSVFIHGDFNLDNIIYDPDGRQINFIDVHRSRHMDYVQDVSVFMVSGYRLIGLDRVHRQRNMMLARKFFKFVRKQAKKNGDRTFEIRLALGLARSFVTSTRFILDPSMVKGMMQRSRYLIERVLETDPQAVESFKVPVKELFNV